MRKLRNLFRQTEFHALLFCIYLILICMPFLAFPAKNEAVNMFAMDMFIYFFVVWGIVIALLFCIAKSLHGETEPPNKNGTPTNAGELPDV